MRLRHKKLIDEIDSSPAVISDLKRSTHKTGTSTSFYNQYTSTGSIQDFGFFFG
jgi:hypothetical protein